MPPARTADDEDARQRVLFIGGLGRSGSTLLALLLNSLPGFVSLGELRQVWDYQRHDLLCSCGERFRACEFWTAVGARAFGGWDEVDAKQMTELLGLVDRHRYLPLLMKAGTSISFERRLSAYRDALSRIYAAAAAIAGSAVVVDSTKLPPFAYVVRGIDDVDLRLVHLVRDSRGVAYSWMKSRQRPEVIDAEAFMDRYRPLSASLRWLDCNLLMHQLVREGTPGLFVKYEELISNPYAELRKVIEHAGERPPAALVTELIAGRRPPDGNHSIAGNPIRFDGGPLRLRVDDEWRSRMRRQDRLLVAALTGPLLWHYGYLGAPVERPRAAVSTAD